MRIFLIMVLLLGTVMPVWADKSLAVSKGCMACHRVDFKYAAPSFHDIAQKYRGQKQAVDHVRQKIVQGSSGAWGAYMTPNKNVTDEEATLLAQWIVALE